MFVSTNDLMEKYKHFGSNVRQYVSLQSTNVKKGLAKWCPDAYEDRKKVGSSCERGYQLLSLSDARAAFEKVIAGKID